MEATYQWAADGNDISTDLKIGDYRAVNFMLYDPSDKKIKLWGANSAGGNTQAEAIVNEKGVVWSHRSCDALGRMDTNNVTFIRTSDELVHVRYIDAVTGEEQEIPLKRK